MEPALAMILAGGRGKRMGMLCQHRAKPILPFGGGVRVIDFTLSNCIHSQVRDILALTDYYRSAMGDYLKRWAAVNGRGSNLRILEPENGSYLGTADAVYQNIEQLKRSKASLVLVLAGDHVYKMDYRRMLSFHREKGADAAVAAVRVPRDQAHRFGIITADENGRVVDFTEKPEAPRSNLVSMGIYVFDKQVLIDRLTEDAAMPYSPHDFGHAIMPGMVNRDRVAAYEFGGYWQDIGTPQAYYQTSMELLSPKTSFSLDGNWPVLTVTNYLPSSGKFHQGAVQNSLVGPGCVIKGKVVNSILSPGVYVEKDALVQDSVVMADTFIGYHSVVDRCILDEGVNVGKLCYLGFGSPGTPGEWGVTMLGEGVTVPSHTAICRSCKVLPYTGPGDFTTKVVSSNSVLSPTPASEPLSDRDKEAPDVLQSLLTH